MFTVKTVVHGDAGDTVRLLEASHVTVRPSNKNGVNAPDQPRYVAPQFELELVTMEGVEHLDVGPDRFAHYQTVYVMNVKGQTVETIHASIQPRAIAA